MKGAFESEYMTSLSQAGGLGCQEFRGKELVKKQWQV